MPKSGEHARENDESGWLVQLPLDLLHFSGLSPVLPTLRGALLTEACFLCPVLLPRMHARAPARAHAHVSVSVYVGVFSRDRCFVRR